MAKNVKVQLQTMQEVAALLRKEPCEFSDPESRAKLADWIEELARYKTADYEIRCALARASK